MAITFQLQGIKCKITEPEEQISDMEDRMVEITATKHNIEKRMKKKNEDSLKTSLGQQYKHQYSSL